MSNKPLLITLSILVIISLLWIMPAFNPAEAAAPDNDEFENARLITSLPFTDTVDVTEATMNPLDPVFCGEPLNSVWYRFTPGQNMNVLFNINESNYRSYLCIYTGDYATGLTFYHGTYRPYDEIFPLYEGVQYAIQVILEPISYPEPEDKREILVLQLSHLPGPENDFYADATLIDQLPYSVMIDFIGAAHEEFDPALNGLMPCQNTVWYRYAAVSEGVVYGTVDSEEQIDTLLVTGNVPDNMEWQGLKEGYQEYFQFPVSPGEMYYLQFCTNNGNLSQVPLTLSFVQSFEVDFDTTPSDPNSHESVQFCDRSFDPAGSQMIQFWWDFGDGSIQETTDPCISYRYQSDGFYLIEHTVLTSTGLTAGIKRYLHVETHDVSVIKIDAPYWGSFGKTINMKVGVRTYITNEDVIVKLYLLGRYGEKFIGSGENYIYPSHGVVDFPFEYTFTSEDARGGWVVFKAIAELESARDYKLRNNRAFSFPVFMFQHYPFENPYPAPGE